MPLAAIDPAGFEEKFQDEIDPWSYADSRFEARKRRALLAACGPGPFARSLELACAIGVTTRALARVSLTVTAVDASPTAVDEARRRTSDLARVDVVRARLPDEMPRGPFDLIVASEIAYYLPAHRLAVLADRMRRALAPGGRVAILHHVRPFHDASQHPGLAHARLVQDLAGALRTVSDARLGRYRATVLIGRG